MGINNLKSLISDCAVPRTITQLKNRKGAFDTSIFIYRFLYRAPSEEECVRYVIDGFLQQLLKFKRHNITPIYIFDGHATQHKKVIIERKKQRNDKFEKISNFNNEISSIEQTLLGIEEQTFLNDFVEHNDNNDDVYGDVDMMSSDDSIHEVDVDIDAITSVNTSVNTSVSTSVNTSVSTNVSTNVNFEIQKRELYTIIQSHRDSITKLSKQARTPTKDIVVRIKELFDIFKVPFIESPIESDALFALFMKHKKIDFIVTEDTDMLPLGCSSFVCGFDNSKIKMSEYFLKDILKTLDLDYKQFVDLCILCGCDYTEGKIEKIGPKIGLKLIQKYNNIEQIIEKYINSSEKLKTKHIYPKNFLQEVSDAREMFYTAHNIEKHIDNTAELLNTVDKFKWPVSQNCTASLTDKFSDFLKNCGFTNLERVTWTNNFSSLLSGSASTSPKQNSILKYFS